VFKDVPGSISDDKKKRVKEIVPSKKKANPLNPSSYVDRDGFVKFPDGSKFKGPLHKGLPEGIGTIIYPDGS
jgi:hypothetical protein